MVKVDSDNEFEKGDIEIKAVNITDSKEKLLPIDSALIEDKNVDNQLANEDDEKESKVAKSTKRILNLMG